ncbi:MAG: riboflavin synthase [Thermoleophilia bacterium]
MFTGLIEEVGTVVRVVPRPSGAHLEIAASRVLEGTRVGDSIAVSGPCLTAVQIGSTSFVADCMPETLARSTLGSLRPGDRVNLERALAVGDRLGGHLVMGHVDAVGKVLAVDPRGISSELRISAPSAVTPFLAPKGSVAVDGISLTVMEVEKSEFVVGIIPHTLAATTLAAARPGTRVNLEADVLARYVHQTLGLAKGASTDSDSPDSRNSAASGRLTEGFLREQGF